MITEDVVNELIESMQKLRFQPTSIIIPFSVYKNSGMLIRHKQTAFVRRMKFRK